VLAYSTISQLGYMFASLGTGTLLGFTAAIFHLLTHAFFKALLFMGAGSVMHSMGGVIDMRRFGGLRRIMPITAATFLVGALALAGVAPFAGFFSKDEILASLHSRGWPDAHHGDHHAAATDRPPFSPVKFSPAEDHGGASVSSAPSAASRLDSPATFRTLFWMALFTAGLTAFYTFRAVFMTFTGPTRVPEEAGHHAHESPPVMTVPLIILAIASAVSGWLLFSTHALADFLAATPSFTAPAVVATAVKPVFHWDLALQGTLAAAIGIALAAYGHLGRRSDGPQMERFLGPLETLFARKFFLDEIYAAVVVKPLEAVAWIAALFDRRVIDGLVDLVAKLPLGAAAVVRQLQTGLMQRYALAGVVGVLAIVVALAWQLRG
jgi:NADH-quinone oxidoreductase subunit L